MWSAEHNILEYKAEPKSSYEKGPSIQSWAHERHYWYGIFIKVEETRGNRREYCGYPSNNQQHGSKLIENFIDKVEPKLQVIGKNRNNRMKRVRYAQIAN